MGLRNGKKGGVGSGAAEGRINAAGGWVLLLTFVFLVPVNFLFFGLATPNPVFDERWLILTEKQPDGWQQQDYDNLPNWTNDPSFRQERGNKQIYAIGRISLQRSNYMAATITADDCIAEVYANGRLVSQERNCMPCEHCKGKTIDLARYLHQGENRLDIKVLNNGGYAAEFRLKWVENRHAKNAIAATVIQALAVAAVILVRNARKDGRTMAEHAPLVILMLFFAYAMYGTLETAADSRTHTQFNYNFFSGIAENYVKYGFIETRLGQVESVNPKGGFVYYMHHPPLLGLLVGASFMILPPLGWSEKAAATLVPTIFSLGSIALVYMLGKRLWGVLVGFVSALLTGLTPMFSAYGQLVCHEPLVTFFLLGTLYTYVRWMDTHERRFFILSALFVAFGCTAGWPEYYILPVLAVHYMIFGRKSRLKTASILIMLGLFMAFVFLAHAYMLGGWKAFSDLDQMIRFRGDYDEKGSSWRMNNLDVLIKSLNNDVKRGATPYLLYASGLLIVSMAYSLIKRRSLLKESYVLALLMVAAIHNFLWPNGVIIHDYWSYYFIPGIALAAVAGVNSFWNGEREYKGFAFWVSTVAFWILNRGSM